MATWDDVQNQYGGGVVTEGKAKNQSPDQVLQDQQQGALARAIMAANGPTYQQTNIGGSSNPSTSRVTSPGMSWDAANATAKTIMGGGGGGGGSSGPSGNDQFVNNPQYSLNQLGAAALGQNMTVTPWGGTADPTSGVSSGAPQPVTSTGVPSAPKGPWQNVPGLMGGQPGQGTTASQFTAKPGSKGFNQAFQNWFNQNQGNTVMVGGQMQTVNTVKNGGQGIGALQDAYNSGQLSWGSQQPSTFQQTTPSKGTVTPTAQANAATIGAPQPFAQPPAAPGVSVPSAQPQPSGLTGQPAPMAPGAGVNYVPGAFGAAPAGIQQPAGFVSSRNSTWSGYGSVAPGGAAAAGGAAALGIPTMAIKRAIGGPVPGQGNRDTIPIMATPGEYVINKQAAQQIGLGNLNRINQGQMPVQHFQYGGQVDQGFESEYDVPEPPEGFEGEYNPLLRNVRVKATQQQAKQQGAQAQAASQAHPRNWQYGQPPAAPGQVQGYSGAPQMTQQERDMAIGRPSTGGGAAPLPTNAAGQPDYHYLTNYSQLPSHLRPNNLGYGYGETAGNYADAYDAGLRSQDPFAQGGPLDAAQNYKGETVGQYADALNASKSGAPGGPNLNSPTAGALGAIGSGLGKVGEQIASSVGSWKPQPSAIPAPPPTNRYQVPGFGQGPAV